MDKLQQNPGFLLVDKPEGMTSFNIVRKVRKVIGGGKVGHAGTLDPMATGLLILGIAKKATRKIDLLSALDKEYYFTVKLGEETDSDDVTGNVILEKDFSHIVEKSISDILPEFTGKILQKPPQFSANKINGKRAYSLARKGIDVPLKMKEVVVNNIEILDFNLPYVKFRVECSKGTYVRSLARDFGRKLDCGGTVSELRRSKIGPFLSEDGLGYQELTEEMIDEKLISVTDVQDIINKVENK